MKTRITCLLLSFSFYLSAQQSWVNYANDHIIWDLEINNDDLWVATHGGIVKIDLSNGEKEIYQAWNSGFRGTGAREIEVGLDGTVWAGGENGGFFKYDGNDWEQFYHINTGDTLIRVVNLKIAPDGTPWFFSDINGNCSGCDKLLSFNGTSFKNHDEDLEPFLAIGSITDFDFTSGSEIWISSNKKIIKYDSEVVLETYDESNSPITEDDYIRKIATDALGNLLVFVADGSSSIVFYRILKFDGITWTIEDPQAPGYPSRISKGASGILSFLFGNSNTNEKTYASFDGYNWTYWQETDMPEFPSGNTNPLFYTLDQEGYWWMGDYNGILEDKIFRVDINNGTYTGFDTQLTPLNANYFDGITLDCDENIWLMSGSSMEIFNGQNWQSHPSSVSGIAGSPWEGAIDPTTCDLWIALYSSGSANTDLARYDGQDFDIFSFNSGSALSVDISSDGTVYVGGTQQGLGRYMDGDWFWFHEGNSPLSNRIYDVLVEPNGTIWAATNGYGLGRRAGTTWTMFNSSNSPLSNNNYWIFRDSEGNIWTRAEIGLAKFDGNDWEIFPVDLPPSGVNCIAEDNQGNFWLGTLHGALYWNGFDFIVYDVSNSDIGSNSIRDIIIDPTNGDIWFNHFHGVSVLSGFAPKEGIHGTVYFDAEQNGVFDQDQDLKLPDQKVMLLPDSTIAITNSIGAYSFYPEESGDYQISYEVEPPYLPTTPTLLDTFFNNENIFDLNFGTWTEDIPAGVSIDITPGQMVCNNEMNVWIAFRNEGFLPIDGTINFTFDPVFEFVNAYPDAAAINDDEIIWEFEDLAFMESRIYNVTLLAPGVDFINEVFEFNATIETTSNLTATAKADEFFLCSYDPNDKAVVPIGEHMDSLSLFENPLQYTIRFQNMGNYLAEDIVIRDVIDPALDLSTFKVLSSSHEMTTTIESGREVIFRFEDINLPPEQEDNLGSQGFVKFQISPLEGLPDPTTVSNTAEIYFDFNPPIITNTTETVLVESFAVDVAEISKPDPFRIYPNPANEHFTIDWMNNSLNETWQIEIYNISGQVVLKQTFDSNTESIRLDHPGFYLIKFQKGSAIYSEKVIITGK